MKNNIKQKITDRFYEITVSENPSGDVLGKINNDIDSISRKKRRGGFFRLRPVIITAIIFIMLVTTIAAAAPYIFIRMNGSGNIDFFSLALSNNNNIRYAGDYDLIRQYSSEVGITAANKNYSFTVDNIAFDGTFLSVFYTVEKKVNILEELRAFSEKWNKEGELNMEFNERNAVSANSCIGLKIDGRNLPLNRSENYSVSDGYLVSDYEIKAMQRFIITEDLPDIFDIEITHYNLFDDSLMRMASRIKDRDEKTIEKIYDKVYKKGLHINLTIDSSESKVEKLTVNPGLSAKITQNTGGMGETSLSEQHNISVDKLSISPLGNIIVLTEAGESDENSKLLFNNFFIIDDKGNIYKKLHSNYRENPEENKTFIVEFFGYVPSDVEYIKIIPYNKKYSYNDSPNGLKTIIINYADFDNLPARIKYGNYGDIIIESAVVTDENVTVTYRTEGMVENDLLLHFDWNLRDSIGGYSWHPPLYDRSTDLHTVTYTFEKPIINARDKFKKIGAYQSDVELLEDQAIVVMLR